MAQRSKMCKGPIGKKFKTHHNPNAEPWDPSVTGFARPKGIKRIRITCPECGHL